MDIKPWTFEVSIRSQNCLKRAGIYTIEKLKSTSDDELLSTPGIGKKCLAEIRKEQHELSGLRWHLEEEEKKLKELTERLEELTAYKNNLVDWIIEIQTILGEKE